MNRANRLSQNRGGKEKTRSVGRKAVRATLAGRQLGFRNKLDPKKISRQVREPDSNEPGGVRGIAALVSERIIDNTGCWKMEKKRGNALNL